MTFIWPAMLLWLLLIPVLVVYVFFQRWIVRGVALSGMK